MLSDVHLKKALPAAAMLNGQVLPVVRPFLGDFERWNQRAAHLTALLMARTLSSSEMETLHAELEQLATEVEEQFAGFEKAVKPLPYHSRVEDLRAAFRRLLVMLRRARNPASSE